MAFTTENIEMDFQNALNMGASEFEPLTEKPREQKAGYVWDNNEFLIEICTPLKS
ncbi:MAG: lactoylglutathione lyase [Maribacter sp.]